MHRLYRGLYRGLRRFLESGSSEGDAQRMEEA